MSTCDLLVMGLYLASTPLLTLWIVGRQKSARAYLGGTHDLPWWGICLSLVATETSTMLTVVSLPGVAVHRGMVFVGLAIGYLLGRCLVAWLLPRYFAGHLSTPYQFLGRRFGAARGVPDFSGNAGDRRGRAAAGRNVAARHLLSAFHLPHTPRAIMVTLMVMTLLYTVIGGLNAVIWSDVIQLCTYLLGTILCAAVIWHALGPGMIGGGVMAMASHGTDHLMAQRILAARSLCDARLALVANALVVGLLFGALSLLSILLSTAPTGASYQSLRGDDTFHTISFMMPHPACPACWSPAFSAPP